MNHESMMIWLTHHDDLVILCGVIMDVESPCTFLFYANNTTLLLCKHILLAGSRQNATAKVDVTAQKHLFGRTDP